MREKKPRLVIPYKRGQEEKFRRILFDKFQVAIKPTNTMKQQLCHQKDPIPFSQQSGVVYCYQCADCPEQCIGEAGRPIEERDKEHKQACERMDIGSSAIAEYLEEQSQS